jgi:hypothetical protein
VVIDFQGIHPAIISDDSGIDMPPSDEGFATPELFYGSIHSADDGGADLGGAAEVGCRLIFKVISSRAATVGSPHERSTD